VWYIISAITIPLKIQKVYETGKLENLLKCSTVCNVLEIVSLKHKSLTQVLLIHHVADYIVKIRIYICFYLNSSVFSADHANLILSTYTTF
jgi:hypothetical protein